MREDGISSNGLLHKLESPPIHPTNSMLRECHHLLNLCTLAPIAKLKKKMQKDVCVLKVIVQ